MDKATLQAFWSRYLAGDKAALGDLYKLCHRRLVFYCLGKLEDRQLAENVASDTLIKLMTCKNPQEIRDVELWIFTVAKNECLMYLKRVRKRHGLLKMIFGTRPHHVDNGFWEKSDTETAEWLAEQILTGKELAVWKLHDQGYSGEEIAKRMNISPKTAFNLKAMARKKLKEKMTFLKQ